MAKEEFSVNELEPIRNTDVVTENKEVVEETEVVETPVIKKVKKEPEYEGPTAKEILVNSVKVDKSSKKNYAGLFVLILILSLIGCVVYYQMSSEKEDNKPLTNQNYLNDAPKWSLAYNTYLKENYEDLNFYEIAFVDFDFDKNVEIVIRYNYINNKLIYEVIDLFEEEYESFKYENVTDVLMMYSFDTDNVKWYLNISMDDGNFHLVDIAQRIDWDTNYEIYFESDTLTEFKSDHMNLSYDIVYTKLQDRNFDKLFVEAANKYESENKTISNLISNLKENYKDIE